MDLEKANKSIKIAYWTAIFSGSFTLIASVVAGFGYSFARMSIWGLSDAFLIFGMSFGIYKKSRVCAVIMFIYWIASKLLSFTEKGHLAGIGIAILFGYFFFQGVRGTFAYHKIANSTNMPKDTLRAKYWIVTIAIVVIVLFAGIFLMKHSNIVSDSNITFYGSDAKETDIHMAATLGSIDEIKSILAEKSELVNTKDEEGQTPLHLAVSIFGNEEVVKFLIAKGADVNAEDNIGGTALHYAVTTFGNQQAAKVLIANGANLDAKGNNGYTPLHVAADNDDKDMVEFLINNGANVNAKDEIGGTVLHHLAIPEGGNREMFELLIAKGADVNARTNDNLTPLHMAAGNGHKDIVELLIAKGADVNARCKFGFPPLNYAAEEGHKDVADLLRKHMKDVSDLLHAIGETGYDDKGVLVFTKTLKGIAPETNKILGSALKQDYTFEWFSIQMLALKMAEQQFRALDMINDADKVNKAIESLETAWSESDLHEILYASFYNIDLEAVLNNIVEKMSEEEQQLSVDNRPVKALEHFKFWCTDIHRIQTSLLHRW